MLRPIAQELAENISRVIGYDVVITDTDGITIGCSDLDRGIGTLNEACAIVGRTGQSRWETEEDARRLKGVKPGVTYPILDTEQHVIGTIAITGDPEKVKPFAQLVKSQAELYLKERMITRELLERERNLQALVADIALFRPGINDPQVIETKAALMGYDKTLAYSVIEIDTSSQSSEDGDYPERDRTLMDIRQIFNAPGDVSGSVGPHRYVVFRSAMHGREFNRDKFYVAVREQCLQLTDQLKRRGFSAAVGIGSVQDGIPGLVSSYREAQVALGVGSKLLPRDKVHIITDFRVEELLLCSEPRLLDSMVERELAPLFVRTDGEELQETIAAWCESGFSVVRAAELLHVHRTTVDYRLEKLESILGVKPRDFREMSRFYWSVILWRNGKGNPKTVKNKR
ncbi:MAG: sugar diacid recognition domain-containing protein [Pyramidobacter sp.]|uniref:CdaR family transcriptional regulator n=1 Tax=Pyramidobacter sp. TaxID=1943581 RepID=UPI002A82B37E|nr:sugar diacid recognition domain-containing protein [Pyramidobacter sp.]MDY4032977.1 sugar diacid recognition domain-containing protein [Pyramidobacter sp.]